MDYNVCKHCKESEEPGTMTWCMNRVTNGKIDSVAEAVLYVCGRNARLVMDNWHLHEPSRCPYYAEHFLYDANIPPMRKFFAKWVSKLYDSNIDHYVAAI